MSEKERVIKDVMAALEREPKVDVHHYPISVEFAEGILTLEGQVKDVAAKKLALELGGAVDAWYLFGVDNVINKLEVRE